MTNTASLERMAVEASGGLRRRRLGGTLHPMKYPNVRNYIGGAFASAQLPEIDVFDPSAGTVISRVPMSGMRELDAAVAAAKQAFPAWAALPIK